jgi:hypothetical protein
VALPPPIFGHGIVGRADLPIPAELFAAAAAAVLVVSFVALATLWTQPRVEHARERRLVAVPRILELLAGALGVAAFAIVVYAGLAGTDSQQDNLAPTAVYVGFWVGIPCLSLLLGDFFRAFSPWRAIGRTAGWLALRFAGEGMPQPLDYPQRLGRWPAVAGILAFGICELAWAPGRDPGPLAILMLAYLAIQLVGMSLYGVEQWTRHGDAFGAYFGLFARLAPLAGRDGTVVVRPPATGAAGLDALPGTVALLLAGIGITAFDGAAEGPLFNDAAPVLQDFFRSLGVSTPHALELAFCIGLAVVVLVITAIYWGAIEGMAPVRDLGRSGLGRSLAHSLIPILAAYVVAHYFSLLAYNGQDLWRLASDPLGKGANLFGAADRSIDYSVVSATAIWYVQVGALVAGHVAGLILAHDRALVLYGDARAASRSQIVMLVLMVCFTFLGLWLLSVANS